MSLLMGILQNDFVIFCSDSRLNGYDNNSYTVQKVFKYNENLIYATGGDKETIDSIIEITRNICGENASYEDFSNTVEDIFRNLSLKDTKNISIFIGGLYGKELAMKELAVLYHKLICNPYNTPVDVPIRKLATNQPDLHKDTIREYFPAGKTMTIDEIKKSVHRVLDLGCIIDDTIDNEMQCKFIKKE